MGFWIFLCCCNLLIPVIMLVAGYAMYRYTPKEINGIYGYRTSMSMKNMETWKFAHAYCGRLWVKLGAVMMAATAIECVLTFGKTERIISIGCGIIETIQLIVLVTSLIPTEIALNKKFDKQGNLR